MKVWLPCVRTGTGTDIYTRRLATALSDAGAEAEIQFFPHALQYAPWVLKSVPQPPGTDLILANSWNGFAFSRSSARLVVVNHLCVFDQALAPYKSRTQALFHTALLRRFESWSYAAADAVVAVSDYTARQLRQEFSGIRAETIYNGIDTEFFHPSDRAAGGRDDGLDILFVGKLSRRKGADLLPRIMQLLGPHHHLYYTGGLRHGERLPEAVNLHPLGRLDQTRMRDAYRRADLVLFPTRLEGCAYAALEAMACGVPVVASAAASMPEIIEHGRTGLLCPVDDVACFAAGIDTLYRNAARRQAMGAAARAAVVKRFSTAAMVRAYMDLFGKLLERNS